jgi:predicted Zn-dependent protease
MKLATAANVKGVDWKFGVVNSKIPNAFALPNASVFVTHGLFGTMQNEAMLAAVLGHEAGHVQARHSIQQLQINLGTGLVGTGLLAIADHLAGRTMQAGGSEAVGAMVGGMKGLIDSGYSRANETEADKLGLRNAVAAGYNPMGMVQLMQTFQRMEGSDSSLTEKYFSSHPASKDRVDAAESRIQKEFPQASQTLPFNEERYQEMRAKFPVPLDQQADELRNPISRLSASEIADRVNRSLSEKVGGAKVSTWVILAALTASGIIVWKRFFSGVRQR